MKRLFAATIVCVALPLAAAPLRAQTTDAHIQDLIRIAAERAGVASPLNGSQTTAGSAAQPAAGAELPTVSLTLEEAIKLALDRNLDISVQRLNPQTFDFS